MKPVHTIPHNAIPLAREKLLTKIEKVGECWNFTGYRDKNGYGEMRPYPIAPFRMYVHRIAYEVYVGQIPNGYTVDHKCNNPSCCNPEHLEAVPHGVNVLRGVTQPSAVNARKTHCKRGHEFTPENTYPQGRNLKGRGCRECRNLRNAGRI